MIQTSEERSKANNKKGNINNNQDDSVNTRRFKLEDWKEEVGEDETGAQTNGESESHNVEVEADVASTATSKNLNCEGKTNS